MIWVVILIMMGCTYVSATGIYEMAYGMPHGLEIVATMFCTIWAILLMLMLFYKVVLED